MNHFNKSLLSLALATSLSMASTASMAFIDTYNPFTIAPLNDGNGIGSIIGNKLIGNYSETLTFGSGLGGGGNGIALGHFDASIVWNLGTIVRDTNLFVQNTNAVAGQNLWALAQFNGTYIPGATVVFLPDGSTTQANALEIFYSTDPTVATNFFPTTGADFYTSSLTATSTLIATGSTFGGSGSETCTPSSTLGCGKFNLNSTLLLLSNNYFISPNPFYSFQFDGGQFNQIATVAGETVRTNGSFDVTFANNVPEPASLALVGLGLLGLGVVRRKKQSD